MLLKRIHPVFDRDARDEGAVLISVIGVSAVLLIVVALVAGSAVTASSFSATTRAALQSRSAADAGIDTVWAEWQNAHFYCDLDYSSADLSFSTTMEYYDEDGDAITCSGTQTLSGTPVRGMVSSTGYASAEGVTHAGDQRTILALFDIEINDHKVGLDKALFTDGGYSITQNVDIIDGTGTNSANVYSNGDVTCNVSNFVQGNFYVQGDLNAGNNCQVSGSVWVGGGISVSGQLIVNGDVMSAGGTDATPTGVDLAKTWVGGSVVANGDITSTNNTLKAYCSIAGYQAKVCGSMVSIEGSVTLGSQSKVAGNIYAKNTVDLGNTQANLIVGGNVISNNSGLNASNAAGSGLRVGGYVAVKGASQVTKTHIGNTVASCATATTGLVACNPASPVIPLTNLPAVLNFPTNTRVVAPPRQSLPKINSDALSLSTWIGWTVENVTCANLDTRIAAGWTGKLLLNITGCTTPIAWGNKTITLPGDLALLNPSGWANSQTQTYQSNNTTTRNFMMIVPSDALLADGTTPLVTWTQPIATDTGYWQPTCAAGAYGDITGAKSEQTKVDAFIYTPCDFTYATQMKTFRGQIYSGTASYPSTATFTYVIMDVPGAVEVTTIPGPPVIVTQTSRFDARG